MEYILFTMITLVVIVAVMANRLTSNSYPFPFDKKATVFTPAEKNFQGLLEAAVGNNYRVINRVKLSDIVNVRKGLSKKATQQALAKAKGKYLDFVICKKESMELVGAIDLVDTSGKGYKLQKDWFVSGALTSANIPHIRVKIKPNYSLDELRACINQKLFVNQQPEPKYKGRVIPAPLVKARASAKYSGALSKAAASAELAELPTPKGMNTNEVAALPH